MLDGGELLAVTLFAQLLFELGNRIEVVGDVVLVAPDDDQHILDAGSRGLFHDVLDRRLVDDRQHLFGHGFGGRKEASAEARRGDHCLEGEIRHGPHSTERL